MEFLITIGHEYFSFRSESFASSTWIEPRVCNVLKNETFKRKTCSFYKYIKIVNPKKIRDDLYLNWSKLEIFGRIYISKEGINAQLSCPIHNWKNFIKDLNHKNIFKDISIKEAIVDGQSFYKLTIKVKSELMIYMDYQMKIMKAV